MSQVYLYLCLEVQSQVFIRCNTRPFFPVKNLKFGGMYLLIIRVSDDKLL